MNRKTKLLIIAVLCMFVLAGCKCKHQWAPATCESPRTCTKCDEVEGSPLGHNWREATCETAKTCKTCGLVSGDALGHTWQEATCESPKTCSDCGLTEGEALEHTWIEASFQFPKTCTACGAAEGEAKAAVFAEYNVPVQQAEIGKTYTVTAAEVPFYITIESFETIELDGDYAALEGYQWKQLTVRVETKYTQTEEDQIYPLHSNCTDYYDPMGVEESAEFLSGEEMPAMVGYSVNYYGTDYSDCAMVFGDTEYEIPEDPDQENNAAVSTVYIHIPEGYDGLVLYYGDAIRLEEQYEGDMAALLFDENTLALRLN